MTSQSLIDTLHINCERFNQCVVDWTIPILYSKKIIDVDKASITVSLYSMYTSTYIHTYICMSHFGFAYGIISVHYKISEYSRVRHACEVRCININTYAILFSFAGRSWMSFWGWSGGQGVLDFVIEQEVAATKLPHWPWFPIWLLKLIN